MKVTLKSNCCTFLLVLLLNGTSFYAKDINLQIVDEGALFMEGRDSILFYQAKTKSQNGKYKRSNYIHPLYDFDGNILTEDFPKDHPHHRGIFWAWHQLYIGDKAIGDGWDTNNMCWDVVSIKKQKAAKGAKSIRAHVYWKSPLWLDEKGTQQPIISEHTQITVYSTTSDYRIIDVAIRLTALLPEIKLGGSTDAKGYGGFSARIKLGENVIFTGKNGRVEAQNLPIHAGGWMDISQSSTQGDGSSTGITIIAHPNNPGYPNPWILRSKASMQNAVFPFPGAELISISKQDPITLQYRLVLHMGDVNTIDISSIQRDFTNR